MPSAEYRDFQPAVVATIDRPPRLLARTVSLLVMGFLAVAGLWLFQSRVDIVVSAHGEVVPAGRVKTVQAADSGVIRHIRVRDGQVVASGDPLIELDGTSSGADQARLTATLNGIRLTIQRLNAELGRPVTLGAGLQVGEPVLRTERELLTANRTARAERAAQLQHELEQAEAALRVTVREIDKLQIQSALLTDRLVRKRRQLEMGLIAGQVVTDLAYRLETLKGERGVFEGRRDEARARVAAAQEEIAASRSSYESELHGRISDAEREAAAIGQELVKAHETMERQIIRAPVDGIVQELAVHTVGAVVNRGDALMVIVPEDAGLELNLKIPNRDIGFVEVDQPVRVKVDAFEFTRYGVLAGDLQWVAADAVIDKELGPVYPARVALRSLVMPNIVNGREARVTPGMRANADIVIGERRLIEYFIEPILRYRDESLRER